MEKNQQLIGLMLMMTLLMLYFWMFGTESQTSSLPQTSTVKNDSLGGQTQDVAKLENLEVLDSTDFWQKSQLSQPSYSSLENDDVLIKFSSKGGYPVEVTLKNFVTYQKKTLVLFNELDNRFSERLGELNLDRLGFELLQNDKLTLSYALKDSTGKSLVKTYRLAEKGFELYYDLKVSGLAEKVSFKWNQRMRPFEQDIYQNRIGATVNFYDSINGLDYLSETSMSYQEDFATSPVKWMAFKQKFFNSGFISTQGFDSLRVWSQANEADESIVKTVSANLIYQAGQPMKFYFGPNEYKTCKAVLPGHAYEKNVNQGWALFAFINRNLIAPIFHFLEDYTSNYGLIILILVIFIKSLLLPLVYSSYKSMATMRVLKPELDEIKAKHGDNLTAIQQEQMQIYQSFGVNPLAGCIPLLAQMPIFLALYNFFPNAIELRQKEFLWATDLSSYDSILDLGINLPFYGDHVSLFTILWVVTTIIQTQMNSQMATQPAQMKIISYVMPFMFLFMFNSFASGLTYYYFLSNIITISQQLLINKYFIDDKKIRAKMEERRAKRANSPAKGSFMQNLQKELENQRNKQKTNPNKKKK
jgi:YidC/Oxa1 family membrane protein insertase